MKRYKCTVFDKRGEFGECMERHKEGRYVTHEASSKKIAELEKELESALYFNIDVTRCLSKIAWEHNHDEIPAYMELSRKCIKSIESKQIEALKEQVKCE
tara:strand:- start:37 stop:336 length:300 start_codon:yes stop_codon:yes gene_type:complete